jgi:glycosyltransferase involved in cell wall biosynthesis
MDYSKKPGSCIKTIGELKNKKDPVISIITPFYNGGKTLEETYNSVLSQTYPFFEWIIVDDGSKDKDSLDKLVKLSKKDSRIRVFHKENGGPSQARDFGISKASDKTKYIFFLDCDDIIANTMLECMYWTLETHKEASFTYTSMINFGARCFYWEPYFTLKQQKVDNLICISSMVRKADLLEVGCFGVKAKAM